MGIGFDVEGALEVKITRDPYWLAGVEYGVPRPGHPEGKVIVHIGEVLAAIEKFYVGSHLRRNLRTIALIHDCGKQYVDRSKQRSDENHHGMIARRWAETFIENKAVLDVIEMHDEASNAFRKGFQDGKWEAAEDRARKLIDRLGDSLELFLAFFRCDTSTGGKTTDGYEWFCSLVKNPVAVAPAPLPLTLTPIPTP